MATRKKSSPRRKVKKAAAKRPTRRAASRARASDGGGVERRRLPETLRLRSITPTYTVNDLHKSIAWYRDGLGFFVSERWENAGKLQGVMLKAGGCSFNLSQDDFRKGRDREKGVGFRIYCDTVQDVDALAKRIRGYGGKIVMEPTDMPWGTRTFTVEDPDGFTISFSQPR